MPHITAEYSANLQRGTGRHGITSAFLHYTRDPDGQRVELFAPDYLIIDPDFELLPWSLCIPQRQTLSGHPAPNSWFEEGASFVGAPVREPALAAQPIVAR